VAALGGAGAIGGAAAYAAGGPPAAVGAAPMVAASGTCEVFDSANADVYPTDWITFLVDGGVDGQSPVEWICDPLAKPGEQIPPPTWADHDFMGWFADEAGTMMVTDQVAASLDSRSLFGRWTTVVHHPPTIIHDLGLTETAVVPGGSLVLNITGVPNATYTIFIGDTEVGTVTLNADGFATYTLTIPADLPQGDHTISLSDGAQMVTQSTIIVAGMGRVFPGPKTSPGPGPGPSPNNPGAGTGAGGQQLPVTGPRPLTGIAVGLAGLVLGLGMALATPFHVARHRGA